MMPLIASSLTVTISDPSRSILKTKASHPTPRFICSRKQMKNGTKTTYEYDGAGRLISKKKGTKSELPIRSLGRTPHAQSISLIKARHASLVRIYDLLDRVIEERVEDDRRSNLSKRKNAPMI